MMEIETIRSQYQTMHDDIGLGGVAVLRDDGEGHWGLYNLRTGNWDWYRWRPGYGYEMTGSTVRANA